MLCGDKTAEQLEDLNMEVSIAGRIMSKRRMGKLGFMHLLDRDGRIRELARLHSGELATDTALRAAAEQLDAAEAYKKSVSDTGG